MANFKINDFIKKFNGETDENVEIWIDCLESAESFIGGKDAKDDPKKLMPLFLYGMHALYGRSCIVTRSRIWKK